MSRTIRDTQATTSPIQRRPSLRRRLLLFLLVPMLVALVLDAVLTYTAALAFSNHVHDKDLANDALTVASMLKRDSEHGELSKQARFLLEYDPEGRDYFSIRSARQGLLDGSRSLPAPAAGLSAGATPVLQDTRLHGSAFRVASVAIANPADAGDTITITIAENLRARRQQARQILLLAVPLQAMLIIVLLLLVRFGVRSGLKVLDPLTQRLARREHELTSIDDSDVPVELLPLTRTIDALFARLRNLMALQERFIADAAHQLRTPLTGLTIHVERAKAHADHPVLVDALDHIATLTARVTRTSNQLLALARAQAPAKAISDMQKVDLAALLRETIEPRLHQAWRAQIDLGYDGPDTPVHVLGDASSLQEMVDNLLDNALRYAGQQSTITVGLERSNDGDVRLSVEDDGPGVDASVLPRLGERFFRDPANCEPGTGLGLAIVAHIAERHGARVVYKQRQPHGLRAEIHFPAPEQTS
ncbi:MAG: ATP-binding protein [Rhodanobacteraceae bacterium]